MKLSSFSFSILLSFPMLFHSRSLASLLILLLKHIRRWPRKVVPFKFHNALTYTQRNVIKSAMKEWQDQTCVKFKRSNPELHRRLGHDQSILLEANWTNMRACKSKGGWSPTNEISQLEVSSYRTSVMTFLWKSVTAVTICRCVLA